MVENDSPCCREAASSSPGGRIIFGKAGTGEPPSHAFPTNNDDMSYIYIRRIQLNSLFFKIHADARSMEYRGKFTGTGTCRGGERSLRPSRRGRWRSASAASAATSGYCLCPHLKIQQCTLRAFWID